MIFDMTMIAEVYERKLWNINFSEELERQTFFWCFRTADISANLWLKEYRKLHFCDSKIIFGAFRMRKNLKDYHGRTYEYQMRNWNLTVLFILKKTLKRAAHECVCENQVLKSNFTPLLPIIFIGCEYLREIHKLRIKLYLKE